MFAELGMRKFTRAAWFHKRCKRDVIFWKIPNKDKLQKSIFADICVAVSISENNLRIDSRLRTLKGHDRTIMEICTLIVR